MIPTEADIGVFLHHGSVMREDFRWKRDGVFRWKAEAALEDTYEQARVKLVGTYNQKTRNLSYALIWAACRIRGLDIGGPSHQNPDGVWVPTPHKHRWTNADRDQWAYRPTDITARQVQGVFDQFLTESSVRFEGAYFGPVEQGELAL